MTDRPIIFSAPMVQALLAGRKTQTRRVLRGAWQCALEGHDRVKTWFAPPDVPNEGVPNRWAESGIWAERHGKNGYNRFLGYSPFRPGDRLWVREAFSYDRLDVDLDGLFPAWYWADGNPDFGDWTRPKPSIHMPRWASRLTLHVTEVRVQRLQEISEADAIREGMPRRPEVFADTTLATSRDWFRGLWERLHGPDAWDANPWVCAITFTVERANIDQARGA